jgi:hypothetical protein
LPIPLGAAQAPPPAAEGGEVLLARLASLLAKPARRRTRRRPARPRDHQRARVYRFEAEHVLPHHPTILSLMACRMLVETAYRLAEAPLAGAPGWQPPLVTDGRGRRHACGSREVIKLPRWARTAPVVLHECAHGLAADGHGAEFVATYLELLGLCLDHDVEALRAKAAASGLRLGPRRPWGKTR